MMVTHFKDAINWALTQKIDGVLVTKENKQALVDKVREYFNNNDINYETFDYNDLKPHL